MAKPNHDDVYLYGVGGTTTPAVRPAGMSPPAGRPPLPPPPPPPPPPSPPPPVRVEPQPRQAEAQVIAKPIAKPITQPISKPITKSAALPPVKPHPVVSTDDVEEDGPISRITIAQQKPKLVKGSTSGKQGKLAQRANAAKARAQKMQEEAAQKIKAKKRAVKGAIEQANEEASVSNEETLSSKKIPNIGAFFGQFGLGFLERAEKKKDKTPEIKDPEWRDPKQKRASVADEKNIYKHYPGFCDLLPWVDYHADTQAFVLEDGRSVGAVFELTPIGTEGRELNWLAKARDAVMEALQGCLEEDDLAPWVVQFFCQDDQDFRGHMANLRDYIKDVSKGTPYAEHFVATTNHHMDAIAKPGGLFTDTRVTKQPWRGKNRRTRLVIYRRLPPKSNGKGHLPEKALNLACEQMGGALIEAGIKAHRLNAEDFYNWLVPWFNPRASLDGHPEVYHQYNYWEAGTKISKDGTFPLPPVPFSHYFSEKLMHCAPVSDPDKGYWYFQDAPHEVVVVERFKQPPVIGALTGEVRKGDSMSALFDRLPEDTVLSLTMVVKPQDILEGHLNMLYKKAIGENLASTQTREDVEIARSLIGRNKKLFRGTLAFYIRGRDEQELHDRHVALEIALQAAHMEPVPDGEEIAGVNSYLRWLPMGYNPLLDKKEWYTKLMWAQHIANLCPVWGRSTGTGNPGLSFFNRGGAPLTVDPLSRKDRAMNAHLLVFGPTGAGKSATLVTMMSQIMAIYRPRLFVVEAGNSFGLLGQFFSKMGLTVNQVALKPGSGISLAPFADARMLIEAGNAIEQPGFDENEIDDAESEAKEPVKATEEVDDKRDVMGELEITARLMITGGDPRDEALFIKADKAVIRRAIYRAAQNCAKEQRTVLTQDVVAALREEAMQPDVRETRSARITEMADAMSFYMHGFEGELFNRDGQRWPEVDVTIVDLAHYAREGKEAEMAMAYIGLMNTVNNIAERDQFSGRPIVMVTDEGHIITKSPHVSGYAVKITKMWRKLGAWFWLATQNLADFPGAARTMLNMIEWWICLVMPKEEVEEIARFRNLTEDQKVMLLSASKENGKFTEGVVLSRNHNLLFRTVPPSLYLALAMTEPEEKLERAQLMREHHCTELEAAFYVAEKLDHLRGIKPMPWKHIFGKDE